MKNKLIIGTLFLLSLSFNACGSDEDIQSDNGGKELSIFGSVKDMVAINTKSIGNDFFITGGEIDVVVESSFIGRTPESFIYKYTNNGIFVGNPGYRFALDDHYITKITATWPKKAIMDQGIITDQSEFENYRLADWMTATSTINENIMPTDKPVPLTFVRENTMLEFELAGQNAEGLNILSLVFELQINGKPTAFSAYCQEDNHAKLLLPAGTKISSSDTYLIGSLTVSNNNRYTIIFAETDLTLEKGKRYLVTLTPQGFFMNAYISIGGWNENQEDGIGIPFQQPDDQGRFKIETPLQLKTMSYLIRHYKPGSPFDWPTLTYIISDNLVMTTEYASQYIPLPVSFSGKIINENGDNVTEIEYIDTGGNSQTLSLYE